MIPHVKPVRAKGKVYYFFRTGEKKPNGSEILSPLPDLKDRDFGAKYAAHLSHRERRKNVQKVLTFTELCDQWEASKKFKGYAAGTKKLYRISIDHVKRALPTAPAGEIAHEDIRLLVDAMEDRPGAANSVIRTLRSLYKWARSKNLVENDPARNIEEMEVGEHEQWKEEVLAAALKAEEPRVRLGVHLLFFTAQRIEDVVRIRKEDIRDGVLHLTQQKTGMDLEIPVHRDLAAELAKHSHGGEHVIEGSRKGRSLHQGTLRDDIQDWVKKHTGADVVPHGLRKNGVAKLLEVGCSTGMVSAISGQSLKMVEHYAKKRNRSKMARQAIRLWEEHEE